MITNRTRRNNPFKQALLPITKETVEEGNDSSWSTTDVNQVTIRKEQDPFLNIPNLLSEWEIENVHPLIKNLFLSREIPKVPLAGRLKHFKKNWEVLTQDPQVLSIVEGYKIPFTEEPIQFQLPAEAHFNLEQTNLIDQEVQMLRKGAIQKAQPLEGQFLSNLFLVKKKDGGGGGGGGNRPVINLKNLNYFIPYHHFKMEGLHLLKDLLQEGDFLCKLDLKDAYFYIPMNEQSRKYVRFHWSGTLWEFLCMCFGLGPAPLIFTKLLKIPIALLRRINIRLIIFLDDMLVMGKTVGETKMNRDTMVFLLQKLGFVINLKKSQLEPVQVIEFLGLKINSQDLTLCLPQEKVEKIINQCQTLLGNPQTTVMDLTSLIGLLSFTAQAVLPGRLQMRYLQQQQILSLKTTNSYHSQIILNKNSLSEIIWWKENFSLYSGKPLKVSQPDLVIQTDASKVGWGASCQERSTGGPWKNQEKVKHINVLELLAVKLAILTFTKTLKVTLIHLQIDNITALSYLQKMGGTKSPELLEISKQIQYGNISYRDRS